MCVIFPCVCMCCVYLCVCVFVCGCLCLKEKDNWPGVMRSTAQVLWRGDGFGESFLFPNYFWLAAVFSPPVSLASFKVSVDR